MNEPLAQHNFVYVSVYVFTVQSYDTIHKRTTMRKLYVCKSNFCDANVSFFYFALSTMYIVFHCCMFCAGIRGNLCKKFKNDKYDFIFTIFFYFHFQSCNSTFFCYSRCSSISICFTTVKKKVLLQRNVSGM